ncbi:MAG TPA: AMP-binding protein [Casimicrobiaceae bacterium]|nr:AMP-binding protein [Casimicrobiaceae bacterium]
MLTGCVPWPAELAAHYRARGLWEGVTIFQMVERVIARNPDKIALIFGELRFTYAELGKATRSMAQGLIAAGIAPLDRVVVQLPNSPTLVMTYLALTAIGAIPVMALRAHRRNEVMHFVKSSAATAYIVPDVVGGFDYRMLAREIAAECPSLRLVLVDGEAGPAQRALDALERDDSRGTPSPRVDPGEVATMLLSGGTTSLSKLIPRTHDDYVLNARLCSAAAGFDEQTVFMAILPLAHNYNLASPGMLGVFYRGGTLVLAPSGDADTVFALVERERVTGIAAVVPLIINWLQSDAPRRYDLSTLRVIQNGGARLQPELRARMRNRFQCVPQEVYGTAEGLINMTRLDDSDELVLTSSGMPVADDDEIRVVDDAGIDVPDGEPGELLTRGPYTIRGYYNAPEKNAEAFTSDGFYRMGDIVRKQARHVFAEGRKKDFINRGGEKISCEEVEGFIVKHPKVKSVALVAMPDAVFGEKACAFVIPQLGETLTFDELTAFLRTQGIASFKLPERLECVDAFPVSPVGKILKRELRESLASRE